MKESARVAERMQENKKETRSSRMQKADLSQISGSLSDRIVFLQRTIGNQGVEKLIRSGTLQAKLKIGQPGDKYEQEANRVADQVMRMPEPQKVPGNNLHIRRACPGCEENELKRQPIKEEEEEKLQRKTKEDEKLHRQPVEDYEEKLQAKEASVLNPEVDPCIENHIQSMKGGGSPLSEGERAFFEPRFGADFSQVRVHTDSKAAESARAVNASAYTVGCDAVFETTRYSPDTTEGKKLLAHELTHTIQQGTSSLMENQASQRIVSLNMLPRPLSMLPVQRYIDPHPPPKKIAASALQQALYLAKEHIKRIRQWRETHDSEPPDVDIGQYMRAAISRFDLDRQPQFAREVLDTYKRTYGRDIFTEITKQISPRYQDALFDPLSSLGVGDAGDYPEPSEDIAVV